MNSNPTPSSTSNPAERFYYDGHRYYLDTEREFVPVDRSSVIRHMKSWGHSTDSIESALCRIQTQGFINFAGPLAGLQRGLHSSGGAKLLAISSPAIIQAVPGAFPTIKAVIKGLLLEEEGDQTQVDVFLAWLKFARESLLAGRYRPGQALALAGPRGCGKSLLIDLTTRALGGRRANPYPFFTGRTHFNADLAGAELLAVDDEVGSTDIRSRRHLAASIKSSLFSGDVRIEGKNRAALGFRPIWRMMMALNDDPEALLVLPPITDDIEDKVILLKCRKSPLPMPAHTMEQREAFFAKLIEELPALLHWLETWEMPDALREERCGVKAFHHPVLLEALHELSPEGQLELLIDTAADANVLRLPWEGTAKQLKIILSGLQATARDAEKLLGHHPPATGNYLARLEGPRVTRLTIRSGIQRWRILPSGAVDELDG